MAGATVGLWLCIEVRGLLSSVDVRHGVVKSRDQSGSNFAVEMSSYGRGHCFTLFMLTRCHYTSEIREETSH